MYVQTRNDIGIVVKEIMSALNARAGIKLHILNPIFCIYDLICVKSKYF